MIITLHIIFQRVHIDTKQDASEKKIQASSKENNHVKDIVSNAI